MSCQVRLVKENSQGNKILQQKNKEVKDKDVTSLGKRHSDVKRGVLTGHKREV